MASNHDSPQTAVDLSDGTRVTRPVLPYAGTSGFSGSDTSEERARRDDSDGTTSERQSQTLRLLNASHYVGLPPHHEKQKVGQQDGLTWKELALLQGYHHGQASGALSNLHKAGLIYRLTERRSRCKVYVLPEYVNSREIEPHGHKPKGPVLTDLEKQQIAGVMETVDRYNSGSHSMHHNIVPIWRVQHLLDIITRLTS